MQHRKYPHKDSGVSGRDQVIRQPRPPRDDRDHRMKGDNDRRQIDSQREYNSNRQAGDDRHTGYKGYTRDPKKDYGSDNSRGERRIQQPRYERSRSPRSHNWSSNGPAATKPIEEVDRLAKFREKYRQRDNDQPVAGKQSDRDSRGNHNGGREAQGKEYYSNALVPVDQQDKLPEKTHIACRRCKQITFSITLRSCYKCGYPKESRPLHFPVAPTAIDPLQLIRNRQITSNNNSMLPLMIELVINDRFGKRQRVKCQPQDTVGDLKKLVSAQIGTRAERIRLQKGNVIYKDALTLDDYELKDGMGMEMYYD